MKNDRWAYLQSIKAPPEIRQKFLFTYVGSVRFNQNQEIFYWTSEMRGDMKVRVEEPEYSSIEIIDWRCNCLPI